MNKPWSCKFDLRFNHTRGLKITITLTSTYCSKRQAWEHGPCPERKHRYQHKLTWNILYDQLQLTRFISFTSISMTWFFESPVLVNKLKSNNQDDDLASNNPGTLDKEHVNISIYKPSSFRCNRILVAVHKEQNFKLSSLLPLFSNWINFIFNFKFLYFTASEACRENYKRGSEV